MSEDLLFAGELLVNGLLVGMMYALVALGFVLIYKASSVFNFAQGSMALFAGFVAAAFLTLYGWPIWIGIPAAVAVMFASGFAIERVVLRPLVAQPILSIIMATLGLDIFLRGLAQGIWGPATKLLEVGIPAPPIDWLGMYITRVNLVGAIMAAVFLLAFAYLFQRTRIGIAMRAVADDHEAALSVGISLKRVWAITWAIAGIVAAAGGVLWGTRLGVDYNLSLLTLKVFPVVILGGLESIPGAILGGLIVGGTENLAAGFIDPYVGGGVKDFFPYLLMLIVLWIRPYGFFGREIIERV
jgi:branched-chain amino acid transport system permease protein